MLMSGTQNEFSLNSGKGDDMSGIQRFKPALVTGYWPGNPESLVRDAHGEYVKFSDMQKLLRECIEWNCGDEERQNIPLSVWHKIKRLVE